VLFNRIINHPRLSVRWLFHIRFYSSEKARGVSRCEGNNLSPRPRRHYHARELVGGLMDMYMVVRRGRAFGLRVACGGLFCSRTKESSKRTLSTITSYRLNVGSGNYLSCAFSVEPLRSNENVWRTVTGVLT
jgi:hypothetical protein